jgi:hypothetical protein
MAPGAAIRSVPESRHPRTTVCGRPFGCKKFFEELVRRFRCFRVSGLFDAAVYTPLACMEFADRVQNAFARSRRLAVSLVFPAPSR